MGAQSEPMPGWANSCKGLNGVLDKLGKGELHCWRADYNAIIDLIPVDYVANLTIAVAWDAHRRR